MIPRIIHYCWFGGKELPESANKCIKSWKKFCPDYEIIQWNESNLDIEKYEYAKEAYEAKKWAFVSDVARLDILYNHGGIYLDTDVELIKPLDDLVDSSDGFMGFEDNKQVASGLGIGAKKNSPIIEFMLSSYKDCHFIKNNGEFDLTPCPIRNTRDLVKIGLVPNGTYQEIANFKFLPREILAPKEATSGRLKYLTDKTLSIHHYDASWQTPTFHKQKRINYILGGRLGSKVIKFLTLLGIWEEQL